MKVEVICSWCNSSMGFKVLKFSAREEVEHPNTHGICNECFDKEMVKINAMPINRKRKKKGNQHV